MAKLSTQQFVEFEQVRDGLIVLKNKTLRGILMVSSLNFALKSEDEQNATLFQFQTFLNSLDFSCQILVHSRRINMVSYLEKLKDIGEKEENELLKIQIAEYKNFIESIMTGGDIMQKVFFVVVPFIPWEIQGGGTIEKLKPSKVMPNLTEEVFQRAKVQLYQRIEFVALGLRRCGLQALPLNNAEIIELFWSYYHPVESERGYAPEIPPEFLT